MGSDIDSPMAIFASVAIPLLLVYLLVRYVDRVLENALYRRVVFNLRETESSIVPYTWAVGGKQSPRFQALLQRLEKDFPPSAWELIVYDTIPLEINLYSIDDMAEAAEY